MKKMLQLKGQKTGAGYRSIFILERRNFEDTLTLRSISQ